jgi:hypothetical protein
MVSSEGGALLSQLGVKHQAGRVRLLLAVVCAIPVSGTVTVAQAPSLADIQQRAAQGDPDAEFTLGVAHMNGDGVLQDFVLAYSLFLRAEAQLTGSDQANVTRERERLAERMTPAQITEAGGLVRAFRARMPATPLEEPDEPRGRPVRQASQPPAARPETGGAPVAGFARGFVMVNGLMQQSTTTFSDRIDYVKHLESGSTTTNYAVDTGSLFGGMGGVRLTRYVGVGVGISRFTQSGIAGVTSANVPHPLYFGKNRTVSAGPAATARDEFAMHVQGALVAPVSERVTVTIFGGPTLFQVRQDLVTDVSYGDVYPYHTITVQRVSTAQREISSWGFNVGADVSVYFSRHVGIGALVQLARGTMSLTSAGGGAIPIDVGGLQVGGGLRLRF